MTDAASSAHLWAASTLLGLLGVAVFVAVRFKRDLEAAEKREAVLRARLSSPAAASSVPQPSGEKKLRIWMDGAFDMMHYGHVNAFRKGRALGTHLVVGVNDDASITKCKGPPVMNDEERLTMVKACKFVDEVVPKVPYVMNDEYVRWMIDEYRIDYVVHGDDPCIVDGRDVYESARALGKYLTIPRTEGVSTTEIVGRMLLLTSHHHAPSPATTPLMKPRSDGSVSGSSGGAILLSEAVPHFALGGENEEAAEEGVVVERVGVAVDGPAASAAATPTAAPASFVRESKFMTTSRMLRLFAQGCSEPPPGAKVVYVDGGWDMFHVRAKARVWVSV